MSVMHRIQRRAAIIGSAIVLLLGASVPLLVTAQDSTSEAEVSPEVIEQGQELFQDICLSCHQAEGVGMEDVFPAVADNPVVAAEDAEYPIYKVLAGGNGMPQFSNLSDDEIAAVLTYVRVELNEGAGPVSAEEVAESRAAIYPPGEESPFPTVPVNMPEMLEGTPQPRPDGTPAATPES